MGKVSLRSYNQEIDALIDNNQLEPAINHCKFILKQYPKHIETYRLLGKAYLESKRYTEASDVFQRVLSVIPDDFVAQIGISIIREDEGNFDSSIWHMERAYEIQPSNSAVQDELRRLFGRRDGIEPPKIRLTRGALVRMYARGDLYPQAIAETRAALAEDPERIDLDIILAHLYDISGQKTEAAEVSSRVITKLPYCLEANRILANAFLGSSRPDDAEIYKQRLYALDPYAAYLTPNNNTSEKVPDNSVELDHLDWISSGEEIKQPEWSSAIGVNMEEKPESDWLEALSQFAPSNEQNSPMIDQAKMVPQDVPLVNSPQPNDSNGWISALDLSTQQIDETKEQSDTPHSDGDVPEWLQSLVNPELSPSEGITEKYAGSINMEESNSPMGNILTSDSSDNQDNQQGSIPSEKASEQPPKPDDIDAAMAWLETLAARQGAEEITLSTKSEDRLDSPPDWIKQELEKTAQIEVNPILNETPDNSPQADNKFLELIQAPDDYSPQRTSIEKPPIEPFTPIFDKYQEQGAEFTNASIEKQPEVNTPLIGQPLNETKNFENQLPDWLKDFEPDKTEPEFKKPLPDWLKEVEELNQPVGEQISTETTPKTAAKAVFGVVLPESNSQAVEAESLPEISAPAFPGEGKPSSEEGYIPEITFDLESRISESAQLDAQSLNIHDFDQGGTTLQNRAEENVTIPTAEIPSLPVVEFKSTKIDDIHQIIVSNENVPTATRGTTRPVPDWVKEDKVEFYYTLNNGQSALMRGEILAALGHYKHLIENGEMVDETIQDLNDAIFRYPQEILLWLTLGDAYVKCNRLKDALDAYTKGEDLLI